MSRLNRLRKKKDMAKEVEHIKQLRGIVSSRQRMYAIMILILIIEVIVLQENINIWVRLVLQLGIVTYILIKFIRSRRR